MKQVIKRVLKGLLPNRFLNAYRNIETLGALKKQVHAITNQVSANVETLGSFKEQINSIANQVNSILWRAEE